jgi:ketosteroid isomerase-like protein
VTGKEYENEYMAAFRFKEGKVLHLKVMMDSLYASKALPEMMGPLRTAVAQRGVEA